MTGLLITIEGIEGSGKSTQIQRLARHLEALGIPILISREPGGTPLGQELRALLLAPHASGEKWCSDAELLLFYADRAQHLARTVRPALEAGKIVLIDRFEDSTRAYQGAQGVSDQTMDRLSEVVLGRLRTNLTVILDMEPQEALKRVETRNAAAGEAFSETRFDNETLDFHHKVRMRFLAIAQKEPQRVAVVPADAEPVAVEAAVWSRLAPLLRLAGHRVE